jgi:hypothetical protein
MKFVIDFTDYFENGDSRHDSDDTREAVDNSGSTGDTRYWFAIYPSQQLENEYNSNSPMIFALVTCSAFIVMTLTFILYDWFL